MAIPAVEGKPRAREGKLRAAISYLGRVSESVGRSCLILSRLCTSVCPL
jgi:hypothetical protein